MKYCTVLKFMRGGVKMGFFDNLLDMFRGGNRLNFGKNNRSKSNSLTNMKDTHVSLGEDSGSLDSSENKK